MLNDFLNAYKEFWIKATDSKDSHLDLTGG